jgi:hypothetical protein
MAVPLVSDMNSKKTIDVILGSERLYSKPTGTLLCTTPNGIQDGAQGQRAALGTESSFSSTEISLSMTQAGELSGAVRQRDVEKL